MLLDQSNQRQPGSARVARVNSPEISGQRSASSGKIRNFAVMKIIDPSFGQAQRFMISQELPRPDPAALELPYPPVPPACAAGPA